MNVLVVIGENPTSSGGLDPGSPSVSLAASPKRCVSPCSLIVFLRGYPLPGLEMFSIELEQWLMFLFLERSGNRVQILSVSSDSFRFKKR